MSFGGAFGGGSQSNRSTSASTTPWTNIAHELAGTLKTNLQGLASGSNLKSWISSITDSFKQQTKSGVADIKEAFAGTGMAGSTDLMRNIANFQTSQSTAQASAISNVEQANVQNQLAALSEIISLASGTGTQTGHQWGDFFNWQANASANLFSPTPGH